MRERLGRVFKEKCGGAFERRGGGKVGGRAWTGFNATEETIDFSEEELRDPGAALLSRLSNVTATFAAAA